MSDSWRVEFTLDGVLPMEIQHELAREGWSVMSGPIVADLDGVNRSEVSRWVDAPLIPAIARSLGVVRERPLGDRRIVRIVAETETEYAQRVARQFSPSVDG